MAVIELPVSNETSHNGFQVELEGAIYNLDFYFNTRLERWVFDILDQGEAPLLVGIPLLTGQSLAFGYTIEGLPPGEFQAVDTTGQNRHADRDTLGNEIKVVYLESGTVT